MYDKTVRRRRAVLGLLVACSLILLTAYFGESGGGALHGVQRGTSEVLNPVQEGASRALKPVRDLFGWFGDTIAAKGQVSDLRAERDRLRTQALDSERLEADNAKLSQLLELDGALGLEDYAPKTGRVIFQSPTVWYAKIRVDKGSDDGVSLGQPVINEEALIGRVTAVFGGSAQVTLITDTTMKVPARAGRRGIFGIVEPSSAGNPTDLVMRFAPPGSRLGAGDRVLTRGTEPDDKRESLYPPGLPIGEITRIENEGTDTQEIHLRPFADMRSLDFVQILTQPRGPRAS
ncbi:MAG TPA: rod shape-determining protein MreC [Solirubrobacteraceae bacterium]|nr:rod shape-determining protein MreC [Solirubrobacteraceae bacterium]